MKKGKKGIGSLFLDFAIVLVVLGGLVAFFRVTGIKDVNSLMTWAKQKSDKTEQCYKNKGEGCVSPERHNSEDSKGDKPKDNETVSDKTLHYEGPSSGSPYLNSSAKFTKSKAKELLEDIEVSKTKGDKNKLDLSEWSIGAPFGNRECWSSKDEVLYNQSAKGSVSLVDVNRNETKEKDKGCAIEKGTWVDPYTGKKIKDTKDISVDYIVPIEVVNSSGGSNWSKEKKKEYSNDPSVLIAMSKDSKEKRGSKSIKDFSPEGKVEKCTLAKNYISVASKYNLSIQENDKKELDKIVNGCNA